jgi:hypothetical protein
MMIVRPSIGSVRELVAGFSPHPERDIAKQEVGRLLTGVFGGTFSLLVEFHLPGLSECIDVLEDDGLKARPALLRDSPERWAS